MTEALYERYKDALRRGHVAVLRGRLDDALEAYGAAARIAPDRALPLVGIAGVLTRLGKTTEALAAYDGALERAPTDEAALRGRGEALAATGDRSAAAEAFDRLAASLDAAGRGPDALDAARRALELAESRGRRSGVRAMTERLAERSGDPVVDAALSRARELLDRGVDDRRWRDADGDTGPPAPFDPVAAIAAVEDAAETGDAEATRRLAIAAAAGHRNAGQLYAAIDACYLALATSPADPGLHLALAELYLDRGWRATAADKLVLLSRIAELTDDAATRERLCVLATSRLPEDARLATLCA